MEQLNEIWKEIAGYEGRYSISSLGRVKSLARNSYNPSTGVYKIKEKIRTPRDSKGYKNIDLYIEGVCQVLSIHRLVAVAFIPNPLNLPVVNHIDKNPSNNIASNLEWVSQRENESHSMRDRSSSKYPGVSWNKRASKWRAYITIDKKQNHLGFFDCEKTAAKAYIDALNKNGIDNKYAII